MCCAHVSKNRQAGFTLIEVMVVIVILAILAGLVVPKVVGQSDKARIKTTETALSTTSNAIDMFKVDNGRYPTTQEGLEALELSKEIKELRLKIKKFNTKYNKKY